MGLKHQVRPQGRRHRELSAEPLVGLKLTTKSRAERAYRLSAEPLVGLKLNRQRIGAESVNAFSRTPRGFEADLRW